MNAFYVYVYFDPRCTPPEPIYVGLGRGQRMLWHARRGSNPFLKRKIAHIREEGLEPLIEKMEEGLLFADAALKECELIAKFGRVDLGTGTLCNFTNGGEGTPGFRHRVETLKLFSEQRKGRSQTEAQLEANRSRKQTPEARARISAAQIGVSRATPESRAATRKYNMERVITDATRQKWSSTRLGKKQTPEHVRAVREAKARADAERRASMTEEEWAAFRVGQHAPNVGSKRTDETRANMRAAWVRRKARQAEPRAA